MKYYNGLIAQLVRAFDIMGSWRNRLAQESYTFKVGGSSPSLPTMKEKISDFYKQKGFTVVYVNINKEPRRVATLRSGDGKITSMSYAKYLYTSYYKTEIAKGD